MLAVKHVAVAGLVALLVQNEAIRMIDVDGVKMRVRTAGLEARAPGQPLVIFESGGSAPLETWEPIFAAVAAHAPALAYDRAGTGQSEWDSLPPTPDRIVSRLQRLLAVVKQPPPYVMVGHSWGGALIRYFAGANSSAVVAMVYIDPTDLTQEPAEEIALLESIGGSAADRESFFSMMEQAMAKAPPAMRAEGDVTLAIFRQDVAGRNLPAVPDVPTSVIIAGRVGAIPQAGVKFDTKRYSEITQQRRVERLRNWPRRGGEFLIADKAGHNVHADAPQLVIDAIRRLLPGKQ